MTSNTSRHVSHDALGCARWSSGATCFWGDSAGTPRTEPAGGEHTANTSALIHRSISELDGVSRGQQVIWDGIALHLMGTGSSGEKGP
jgi:hypothetical protein